MKAVTYYSYDDIRIEYRHIPTIIDDELLVKVHGCGLYGSDRKQSITSTYSSSPEDLRIALALLESRKVRVDALISHRLPLDQFAEGVALMQKHAALKVYFHIAGES